MIDYRFWFFMVVTFVIAFMLGRLSKLKVYFGPDEEKYKKADFSILTKRKRYL